MAKKKAARVNKSAKIREYSDKHPTAKPRDIVAALGKAGIKVSAQQVSSVRTNAKKKKLTKKRPAVKRSSAKSPVANSVITHNDLLEAKQFAKKVGGVAAAEKMLAALADLQD